MITNLRDCYILLGGDYDDVMSRLPREQLIQKFIFKFLDEKSYQELERALAEEDYETAFRAAHTIKGNCQNLSFSRLSESSSQLTEALRMGDYEKAVQLLPKLSEDYLQTTGAIREYKQFLEGSV